MGNAGTKQEAVILKIMGTGISMNILDSSFTMLWGNPIFYELTGYTAEEFAASFVDFKQYFKNSNEDFQKLHEVFTKAWEQGKSYATTDIRFPIKNGTKIWVRISGTITNQEYGVIVNFSYTNIDDIIQQQSELCQITNERSDNFEWMMAEYTGNVYISDMDTYELLYVNRSACEVLQALPEQVIGRKCYEVIQGRTTPCPFCTNAKLKKDETYEWEFFNPNLNRTFMIKNRLLNWKGHRSRIELSHDMYSPEYKLAKKDQEREAILKTIPAGMVRIDAKDCNTVLWHNGIFLDMIGYTEDQFVNELHNTCSYLHPDDQIRTIRLVNELKKTGDNVVFEARSYNRKREERLWTVTLCYISGEDSWDGIPSYYSLGLDITDERKKIEHLTHKAEKDDLTDVYNREGIETQIKDYLNQHGDQDCALLMIDADNFKYINDNYGHMTGDLVLREMADGMKKWMSQEDIVGRIGGDEFIVFMKAITDPEATKQKAIDLLTMFRNLFRHDKKPVNVSCSIGIAYYPKDGNNFEELYGHADKALYHAKLYGKNNFAVYTDAMLSETVGNVYPSMRTEIDSKGKRSADTDKIVEKIFQHLYRTYDFEESMQGVLEILEEHFGVSRAYIIECTKDSEYADNTYEWCNKGVCSKTALLQRIPIREIYENDEFRNNDYIFYNRDENIIPFESMDQLFKDDAHSTLLCSFRKDKECKGFIGYDECFGKRKWTADEIAVLTKISHIIDVFQENFRTRSSMNTQK